MYAIVCKPCSYSYLEKSNHKKCAVAEVKVSIEKPLSQAWDNKKMG